MDIDSWDLGHMTQLARQYAPGYAGTPESIPLEDRSGVWFALEAIGLPRDWYIAYLMTSHPREHLPAVYAGLGLSNRDLLCFLKHGHQPSIGISCFGIIHVRLSHHTGCPNTVATLYQCLRSYCELGGIINWKQVGRAFPTPAITILLRFTKEDQRKTALARLRDLKIDPMYLDWLAVRYPAESGQLLPQVRIRGALGTVLGRNLTMYVLQRL